MKTLVFFLCILIAGCATAPKTHYHFNTISQKQVISFISETNDLWAMRGEMNSIVPYAVPTSKWVEKVFTPRLDEYLFKNNLKKWVAGENDCVKFTTHGISEAYTAYRQEVWREPQTTLAVGSFDYFPNPVFSDEGHEIMFFIIDDNDGKGYKLKFYEPQSRRFINLDFFQRMGAYRWRM